MKGSIRLGQLLYFPEASSVITTQLLAVRGSSDVVTRDQFVQDLCCLTHALSRQSPSSWLLHADDSAEFALALLALLCAGKQISLAPNRQPGTLDALSIACDAVLSDETGGKGFNIRALIQTVDAASVVALDADTEIPEQASIILSTSGSTGEFKHINKPLRSFIAEVDMLDALWGSTLKDATTFATVSHQHVYGLLFRLLWPLSRGRVFRADTHMYPEQLFADMQASGITVLISSPAHLKRIPPAIAGDSFRSTLQTVFSSGGPLTADDAVAFSTRFGRTPIEVFGSTETGGVAYRQQSVAPASATWTLLPAVQCKTEISSQTLAVRSPFCFVDDWYMMGDRVQWLDDQHFLHLGRSDRIVKLEEKRVSLTAMEEELLRHPSVSDARIVLLDAIHGRQQLGAVVVMANDHLPENEKQRRALSLQFRDRLLAYFERSLLPRKWRYVEQLPCNSQGKVTQSDLCALFARTNYPQDDIQALLSNIEFTAGELRVSIDTSLHQWLFDGHFAEMPILPGVIQLDWVIRLAQQHWYPQGRFKAVSRVKFLCPVQPGDVLDIHLRHDGRGKVNYEYSCAGKAMSSGSFMMNLV